MAEEAGGPPPAASPHAPSLPTPTSAPELPRTASATPPPSRPRRRASSGAARATGARPRAAQERIDGILELGRLRAISMPPPGPSAPAAVRSPPPAPRRGADQDAADEDSEPNETTGIFMKGPRRAAAAPMNYHSTATAVTATAAAAAAAGARPRRNGSSTARRREGTAADEAASAHQGQQAGHDKEAGAWWKAQLAEFGSIELENKGSVARDHLALERTFLAWLRTSLSFASIGIAITQLFRLNTSLSRGAADDNSASAQTLQQLGKPLGAVFLSISILMLFLGYHRYVQAQQWIIKGKFPASRGTVVLVSLVALGLMVVSLCVAVSPPPP